MFFDANVLNLFPQVLKLQDFNENIGFNLRFSELKDSGGAYVMSTDGTPLKVCKKYAFISKIFFNMDCFMLEVK